MLSALKHQFSVPELATQNPWSGRGFILAQFLFLFLAGAVELGCSETIPSLTAPEPQESTTPQIQPLPPPYSLGILPFEDHTNRQDLAWLKHGIPDMLTTDLTLLPGLEVVPRPFLGEILREQWLQLRGTSTPDPSVKMGKLEGARYLLKGDFYVIEEQLVLEAHILDVERGTVIRSTRQTGEVKAIPALEHRLAHEIGRLFDQDFKKEQTATSAQSANFPTNVGSNVGSEESKDSNDVSSVTEPQPISKKFSSSSTATSGLLISDALLSLEKRQREREDAWWVVESIWKQSLSITLGPPQFHQENASNLVTPSSPKVWVPVSAEFPPDSLSGIHKGLQFTNGTTESFDSGHGVLVWKGNDPGADRLFRENIRKPRRLFVRALSSSGEVTAVSSLWTWRVDRLVTIDGEGPVQIPVSPQPLLSGLTSFPSTILSDEKGELKFDVVIVSVPQEGRKISVASIEDKKSDVDSLPYDGVNERIGQNLKLWLTERWMPPLMESIPVGGYLPGNIRTIKMLISVKHGTVHDVQLIHLPLEEPLISNIHELKEKLVGWCFYTCTPVSENKDDSKTTVRRFMFRVQLDLIKDVKNVGLGDTQNGTH